MLTVPPPTWAPQDLMRADGTVALEDLTRMLQVSGTDLATVLGLSRDAVSDPGLLSAAATQRRLYDLVDILAHVVPWAGSGPQAYAWFCAQPLPSFGDQTAAELLRDGRTDGVKTYLMRIAQDGYA